MTGQFVIGSILMILSFAVHAGFMAFASRAVDRFIGQAGRPPSVLKLAGLICAVTIWLMASMSATVWIWALYFVWAGALSNLETAMYFSLVSFTTLGFGDIVLSRPHRLLSGMLAANGLVLLGLSTAILIDLIRMLHPAQSGPGDRSG